MRGILVGALLSAMLFTSVTSAKAATVTLSPTSDTLFELDMFDVGVSLIDETGTSLDLGWTDWTVFAAAINFDLSSLPTDAIIDSVSVHLDVTAASFASWSDGVAAIALPNDATLSPSDINPADVSSNEFGFGKPSGAGALQITFDSIYPGGRSIQEIFDSGATHLTVFLLLDLFGGDDSLSVVSTEGAANGDGFAPYLTINYTSDSAGTPAVVPAPASAVAGCVLMATIAIFRTRKQR